MTTIYIAEDGKQFYDEDECIQYERERVYSGVNSAIKGLTPDGKPLAFSDPNFCDSATSVYLASEKAVEVFKKRCDNEGINNSGIDEPGVYVWNDCDYPLENYTWLSLCGVISYYEDEIAKLREIENKFPII